MSQEQSSAIIYVDGEEFMRVWDDAGREMYEETMRRISEDFPGQHEYALMVWKPRHGFYLRERLDIR